MAQWPKLGAAALSGFIAATPIPAIAQVSTPDRIPAIQVFWVDIGRSPEELRRVQPIGDWEKWITPADFPVEAFPSRRNIFLSVRVSTDDRIVQCVAPREGADPALVSRLCELLSQRGRFRHALSAQGKPVESETKFLFDLVLRDPPEQSNSVTLAPAAPPMPVGSGIRSRDAKPLDGQLEAARLPSGAPNQRPMVELDVSAEGIVTQCNLRTSTGTDAGDIALCQALRKVRFVPATDDADQPIAQRGLRMPVPLR